MKEYRAVMSALRWVGVACAVFGLVLSPGYGGAASKSPEFSLEVSDKPLRGVLEEIKRLTGYTFTVDDPWGGDRLTLKLDRVTVDVGLRELLKGYDYVLLYQRLEDTNILIDIRGRVNTTDLGHDSGRKDGSPVAAAGSPVPAFLPAFPEEGMGHAAFEPSEYAALPPLTPGGEVIVDESGPEEPEWVSGEKPGMLPPLTPGGEVIVVDESGPEEPEWVSGEKPGMLPPLTPRGEVMVDESGPEEPRRIPEEKSVVLPPLTPWGEPVVDPDVEARANILLE